MKGWRTLIVREETFNRLRASYEKHKEWHRYKEKNITFTAWLDGYILTSLEDYELLQRYAPALEYIGTTANTIIIKDYLKDVIAEVELSADDKSLYCRYCETDNCIHIGFCFAIKDVNRILIKHGFRKPRIITLFGDEETKEHKEDEQG